MHHGAVDHLDDTQLQELRAALQTTREELLSDRARHLQEVAQLHAPDVGDGQDVAAGEASRQREAALLARHEAAVREVEAALARMDDGSYGVCEDTDEPIPFGRLRLEPATRLSVEAKEDRESRRDEDEDGGRDASAY